MPRLKILAVILLGLAALSGRLAAQAQVDPNHIPPVNVWWSDSSTYTATIGAGATFDFSGCASLTLGSVAGGVGLGNGVSLSATTGQLLVTRSTAGTVTITAADDNSTAALAVLPGGAAAMTLGGASTTEVIVTTDGGSVTIDGAVAGVAPAGITADLGVASWTFTKTTAGGATLVSADDDANANMAIQAGGTGALTLGDAASTTAITSSDWAIGATGIATGLGAITSDGTIQSGGTFTATGAVTYDAGGASAIIVGSADVTSITLTTDGSGTAEVVLPLQSVAGAEILNDTVEATEIDDTLSPEAGQTILCLGSMEVGVVDGNFDLTLQMGDNAGVNKIQFDDSDDQKVFAIDSNGQIEFVTNGETLDVLVDDVFQFSRDDAGAVTLTSADNNATADLTVDPGGNAVLSLGSASDTVSVVASTGVTLSNSERVDNNVNGTITLARNDAGTVTVTSADDDATAALSIVAGGTATLTLGDSADTVTVGATTGLTLANAESVNTGVDAAFDFTRSDAGAVTLTSSDDDGTAALTLDPGGNAALTLGSASDTIAIPVTAGIALSNLESLSNGTNGALTLGRNDAGTVTLTSADDDATAALTIDPGGNAALTLGSSSDTITATVPVRGVANVGAKGADVGAAAEFGDGYLHRTVLSTIAPAAFTVVSGATTNCNTTLYTFPEGYVIVDSVHVAITCASATLDDTPFIAVGSAVGSGTLTTVEQDMLLVQTGTAISAPGGTTSVGTVSTLAGGAVTAGINLLDGTASASVATLNISDASWSGNAVDLTVTGTVTIIWRFVADD